MLIVSFTAVFDLHLLCILYIAKYRVYCNFYLALNETQGQTKYLLDDRFLEYATDPYLSLSL